MGTSNNNAYRGANGIIDPTHWRQHTKSPSVRCWNEKLKRWQTIEEWHLCLPLSAIVDLEALEKRKLEYWVAKNQEGMVSAAAAAAKAPAKKAAKRDVGEEYIEAAKEEDTDGKLVFGKPAPKKRRGKSGYQTTRHPRYWQRKDRCPRATIA